MKLNWNFQRGVRLLEEIPSMGEGHFLERHIRKFKKYILTGCTPVLQASQNHSSVGESVSLLLPESLSSSLIP